MKIAIEVNIMANSCALCGENIQEEYGKLKGTAVKVKEDGKNKLVYVCSSCMKMKGWLEQVK